MKATVEAKALAAAVRAVAPLAKGFKGGLPVLAMIRLEADGDRLVLTAGDIETFVSTSAPAVVHEPGVILVPGPVLAETVGALEGEVELGADATSLVALGRREVTLPVADAADYPRVDWLDGADLVPMGDSWPHVSAVSWAMGSNPAHPHEMCLRFYPDGAVVAANDAAMGWAEVPSGIEAAVPKSAVATALRTMDAPSMATGDRTALFTDGTTSLLTTLVTVNAFDWRRVAEMHPSTDELSVDSGALLDELAAVSLVKGPVPITKVRLRLDGDVLDVARRVADGPGMRGAVDATGSFAGPLAVAAENLSGALRATGAGMARIGTSDPLKPIRVSGEDAGVGALLMPVRLGKADS